MGPLAVSGWEGGGKNETANEGSMLSEWLNGRAEIKHFPSGGNALGVPGAAFLNHFVSFRNIKRNCLKA